MTATGPADVDRVEFASWLAPGLLMMLARVEPLANPGGWRLLVEWGEDTLERQIRWLPCADVGAGPARQAWMLTVSLPPRLAGAPLSSAVLRAGDARRELAPASLQGVLCEPAAIGAECRAHFDASTRLRMQDFLASTAVWHDIELTPDLAATLAALRDALRERLPTTKLEPGPFAARLEEVTVIDELGFWLTGWIHDAAPRHVRFTAVSPEGSRRELPTGAVSFHPRPAYAKTLKDDASFSTLGYHAYVELDHPSRHPEGWVMEFRTTGGRAIEHAAFRAIRRNSDRLRGLMIDQLGAEPGDEAVHEHQMLPVMTRLRRHTHGARIDRVVDLGNVPRAPELSIVVAARRVDRIDHQLLSFASDPDLEDTELIYVAAPKDPDEDMVGLAEGLYDLHGLPFRLAIASGPLGRSRAFNLGASLARGSLLVLMGGEVFPSAPGWIAKLRELLEGSASVGAVGPRLLFEDDSIAHAGVAYVRRSTGRWRRSLPFAGLARTMPGAGSPRRVQAVSAACMMVSRELFDRCGHFSELYLDGGDEGGDLCLRLADAAEVWYVPDAELHLLDEDPPRETSRGEARFNEWLFDHRCGDRLAATAPDEPNTPMPARMPRLSAIPGFGSGRSGAPVESLEMQPPQLDRGVVLDASLELRSAHDDGAYTNTYTLAIAGWAIASEGGPLTIEVSDGAEVRWRTKADMRRPDIGAKFPDRPAAAQSGFQFLVSSLSLPTEFQLEIVGVSASGARASLGHVRGRRRTLGSAYRPRLQPLLITTLGRSGSAWLAALLSLHPEIVGLSPFRFEAKLTTYWMDVLHTLAEPASYMQTILPEISDRDWWIGSRQSPLPVRLQDTGMPRWLGREHRDPRRLLPESLRRLLPGACRCTEAGRPASLRREMRAWARAARNRRAVPRMP